MNRKAVYFALAGAAALLMAWLGAGTRILPRPLPDMALGVLCGMGVGALFAAALKSRLPPVEDTATPGLHRRYRREFAPAILLHAVALLASVSLLSTVDQVGLRVLVALLPVPFMAMALRAVVRYVRDADEMQQRIELETISVATAIVALLYLTGSYLQAAHLVDIPSRVAMVWVLPLLCAAYGVVKVGVVRRYS